VEVSVGRDVGVGGIGVFVAVGTGSTVSVAVGNAVEVSVGTGVGDGGTGVFVARGAAGDDSPVTETEGDASPGGDSAAMATSVAITPDPGVPAATSGVPGKRLSGVEVEGLVAVGFGVDVGTLVEVAVGAIASVGDATVMRNNPPAASTAPLSASTVSTCNSSSVTGGTTINWPHRPSAPTTVTASRWPFTEICTIAPGAPLPVICKGIPEMTDPAGIGSMATGRTTTGIVVDVEVTVGAGEGVEDGVSDGVAVAVPVFVGDNVGDAVSVGNSLGVSVGDRGSVAVAVDVGGGEVSCITRAGSVIATSSSPAPSTMFAVIV